MKPSRRVSVCVSRFSLVAWLVSLFVGVGDYATSASSSGLGRKKKMKKRALRNWTFILGFLFIFILNNK